MGRIILKLDNQKQELHHYFFEKVDQTIFSFNVLGTLRASRKSRCSIIKYLQSSNRGRSKSSLQKSDPS